jgi:dienelactone hydrolase
MAVSWVDMQSDGQTMEGYLTQPAAAGRYPAVIVIQEI